MEDLKILNVTWVGILKKEKKNKNKKSQVTKYVISQPAFTIFANISRRLNFARQSRIDALPAVLSLTDPLSRRFPAANWKIRFLMQAYVRINYSIFRQFWRWRQSSRIVESTGPTTPSRRDTSRIYALYVSTKAHAQTGGTKSFEIDWQTNIEWLEINNVNIDWFS